MDVRITYKKRSSFPPRVLRDAEAPTHRPHRGRIQAVLIESKAARQAVVGAAYVHATGDGDLAARRGMPF